MQRCSKRSRTDTHGDHVLLQAFAKTHAGIEATLDHVGETVLDGNVENDIGIGQRKGGKLGRQHQLQGGSRHGQSQIAGRPVAYLDGRLQRQIDFGKGRPQAL